MTEIVALAGGVGASKLLLGLSKVMDPQGLTGVVNTGDDITLHGLEISPDLDIVTYTLAGAVNPETGWGIKKDTFFALKQFGVYGRPRWFHLGDRDLATHIYRTELLREGATLSQAAEAIRCALGVRAKILPMSDQPVRTTIETKDGQIHIQEYLVKLRAKPVIRGIRFEGSEAAKPAPGVIEALRKARSVVICPSNPLISIGPILAVPGIRERLRERRNAVLGVCPIVKGKSLKGPSDRMMTQMGLEASAVGVAKLYGEICGTLVIDRADAADQAAIEALGMKAVVCQTVMRGIAEKVRLARDVRKQMPVRARGAHA